MKKRLTGLFIVLSMLIALVPGVSYADASGIDGIGTEADPYVLSSSEDIINLANNISDGSIQTKGMYFEMTKNIDISNDSFSGFGNADFPFEGSFDGNGNTLTVNMSSAESFAGLFPYIGDSGTVKALTLEGGITGTAERGDDYYIGGIAGENRGEINGCINKAEITAKRADDGICVLAGIAGYNYGTIRSCVNMAGITAPDGMSAAGIAGSCYGESTDNQAQILYCANAAQITANDKSAAGILLTANKYTVIENCRNEAAVKSESGCAAGIVYDVRTGGHGTINKCVNESSIEGGGNSAGGIAAVLNGADVSRCSNTGSVICTRESDGNRVGGIVGDAADGNIYMSYNAAEVTAEGKLQNSVGGIAGEFGYTSQESIIENCYNSSAVKNNGTGYAGGIAGINYAVHAVDLYNTGSVSVKGEQRTTETDDGESFVGDGIARAGGIAGGNMPRNSHSPIISFSYNTGKVTQSGIGESDSRAGGIVGENGLNAQTHNEGSIKDCYYLANAADTADGDSSSGSLDSVSDKTRFVNWDFDYTWEMESGGPVFKSEGQTSSTAFETDGGDLKKISENVKNGSTYIGKYFAVADNVNLGSEWVPIGGADMPFEGNIDGRNHQISVELTSGDGYSGFVGNLGRLGSIKNLAIDGTISVNGSGGNVCVGAFAGCSEGTIAGCTSIAVITVNASEGNIYAGGIAGYNNGGTISQNHNQSTLTVIGGETAYAGGIAGFNDFGGIISDNYSDEPVSVSGAGTAVAGQTAGSQSSTSLTKNCYYYGESKGNVSGVTGDGSPFESCYYLADASDGNAAITEAQFSDTNTFYNWDFDKVWRMDGTLLRPSLRPIDADANGLDISGFGTEEFPYELASEKDLMLISDLVANGHDFAGTYFKVIRPIEIDSEDWVPIGASENTPFKGSFDGGGYPITLNVDFSEKINGGCFGCLFGYVSDAHIENVVTDGRIDIDFSKIAIEKLPDSAAVQIGQSDGSTTVSGCVNQAEMNITMRVDTDYMHGVDISTIVGNAKDGLTVSGCTNHGDINIDGSGIFKAYSNSSDNFNGYAAGIAGNADTVTDCVNNGDITVKSTISIVTGIVGYVNYVVKDCVNNGDLTIANVDLEEHPDSSWFEIIFKERRIAGIVDRIYYSSDGTGVKSCANNGDIKMDTPQLTEYTYKGKLAGIISSIGANSDNDSVIEGCENHGDIYMDFSKISDIADAQVISGGIVSSVTARNTDQSTFKPDENHLIMVNCYNDGNIYAEENAGGHIVDLRGGLYGEMPTGKIKNCYNYSEKTKGTDPIGPKSTYGVSTNRKPYDTPLENCYFLNDNGTKSQLSEAKGISSEQFANIDTFKNWDLSFIWEMDEELKRPVLRARGTEQNPYIVDDVEDLIDLSESLSGGINFEGEFFKMTKNIVIDESSGFTYMTGTFQGTFDGNGNKITATTDKFVRVFSTIGENAVVKNLSVTTENDSYGGLIANNVAGTIENCTVDANIYANDVEDARRGLIANETSGHGAPSIRNCTAKGSITVSGGTGYVSTGGIIGEIDVDGTEITDCSSTVNIIASDTEASNTYTGGIAGGISSHDGAKIAECHNSGNVFGEFAVGGIVGYVQYKASILNCFNDGEVRVGADAVTPDETSNSLVVRGGAGGIAGSVGGKTDYTGNMTDIINCYNYGPVRSDSAGIDCCGIAATAYGDNWWHENVPYEYLGEINSTSTYWLESSADFAYRDYNDGQGGIVNEHSVSREQLADIKTFADWDFGNVWIMDEALQRPVLRWEKTRAVSLGDLSGSGTAEDPYQISDKLSFEAMKKYVDDGNDTAGLHFILTEDIDLGGLTGDGSAIEYEQTAPIGGSLYEFGGTFDGNHHKISGLYINSDLEYVGLFARLSERSEVKDLTIESAIVRASRQTARAGAIAGQSGGTITGCINKGSVTNVGAYTGGIVGSAESDGGARITECGNEGAVAGGLRDTGGIVGALAGVGQNLYNIGTVTGSGDENYYTGGIAGRISALLDNGTYTSVMYNTGEVSGADGNTAQFVGTAESRIKLITHGDSSELPDVADGTSANVASHNAGDDLSSGMLTHELNGESENKPWRQRIGSDTHPTFSSDGNAVVYKVTFMKKAEQDDGSFVDEVYHEEYINPDGEITYPEIPTDDRYKFKWWTADTESKAEFVPPVVGDTVLYAVGEEMYGGNNADRIIRMTYGTESRIDLSEYVRFAAPREIGDLGGTSGKFTYTIVESENCDEAYIFGDSLVVPAGVDTGIYKFIIKAERKPVGNDELVLLSAISPFDLEPVQFDIRVIMQKQDQVINPPEMAGNSATSIRLKPMDIHGTVDYALIGEDLLNSIYSDEDYDNRVLPLIWRTNPVFEGLTPNTRYYAYARTEGDNNYNGAASYPSIVYTSEHIHTWTYSRDGNTITAQCIDDFCPDRGGGSFTLDEPSGDYVYDRQAHPPVIVDTLKTNDVPVITYYYKPFDGGDYTVVDSAVNAGDYRVTATLGENVITVEYSILKAHLPSVADSLTYQAYYGDTLEDIELPAGYAWKDDRSASVGTVGMHTFKAVFTPSDTQNCYSETLDVIVEVQPKPESIISAGDVKIDYAAEQLQGFEYGNYAVICGGVIYNESVGADGAINIRVGCFGQDITIVKKARNSNYTISERITVSVPDKPAAPEGLEAIKADAEDSQTGKIIGVTEGMEYRPFKAEEWISVDSGEAENLLPGAYYVRVKQSGDAFAGRVAIVAVGVKSMVAATFVDGDDFILKTENIPSGTAPTYDPAADPAPTKSSTAQYDYTFRNWDKDISEPIVMDTVYTAQFDNVLRSYSVRWIVNGTVKKTETYNYGAVPDYGSEPEREGNAWYSYKFSGWYPEIEEVTGNEIYAALFERLPRTYMVTLNPNGGEMTDGTVTEYTAGMGTTLPAPVRDGYSFLGWYDGNGVKHIEIGITEVGDKEFNARWLKVRQRETIIDSSEIVTDYANETLGGFESGKYLAVCGTHAEIVDVTDAGTIPISEDYFGNTIDIMRIARDENYLSSIRVYTEVDERPEAPVSAGGVKASELETADGRITGLSDAMEYRSAGDAEWIPVGSGESETGNLTAGLYYVRYKATDSAFASGEVKVTVGVENYVLAAFVDGDGKAVKIKAVQEGTSPEYTETDPVPIKKSTVQYEYTFNGWDKDPDEPISDDTIYTAQFDSVLREYTVTWIVNGVSSQSACLYGTMPSYGSTPTKDSTDTDSYEFAGWYPSIMTVSRDQIYIAVFDETARKYKVTLDPNGGTLAPGSDVTSYTCGEARNLPTANEITKDGCDFLGWYDENGDQVTRIASDEIGDKTYTAHWDTTVTKEDIISESDVVTDYEAETLGNFEDGDYLIVLENLLLPATVTNGTIPIKEIYFGRDIQIIKKARDGYHTDSDPITVSVKERPAAPDGITVNRAADDSSADGAMIGVTSDMEYRGAKTDEWISPQRGQTRIDGLRPGVYYVRIKQIGEEFHGHSKIVVVGIADKVTAVFVDGDDNLLYAEHIAPGSVPEYHGQTPTKSETDAYRYEFSGWNNDITQPLTVDTVFVAQFAEIPKTYGVILDPNGGTIADGYDITEYTYGDAVKLPDADHVTRDGFDFAGWHDGNGRLMTEIPQYSVGDVEYTADWTASTDEPQPTTAPTDQPTTAPTDQPTTAPTDQPAIVPSDQPATEPTPEASTEPSSEPSGTPAPTPTNRPSYSGGGSGGGGGSSFGTGGATATPKPTAAATPGATAAPGSSNAPDTTVTSNPVTTAVFEDVPADHWAYSYIMDLYNMGIINGETPTMFVPDDNVTRAEFAKMAALLFGLTAQSAESQFADVTTGDWFAPYVIAAAEAGIVNGTSDTTFSPNDDITREQIAAIIGRQMSWTSENAAEYSDAASIEAYALPYVNGLTEQGILTGDNGMFRPKDNATRAESAAIIDRVKNH